MAGTEHVIWFTLSLPQSFYPYRRPDTATHLSVIAQIILSIPQREISRWQTITFSERKIGYGLDADATSYLAPSCCLLTTFTPIFLASRRQLVGILLLSVRHRCCDRPDHGRHSPIVRAVNMAASVRGCCGWPSLRAVQRPDVHHAEWTYHSKVIYAFVTYFLLSLTYTAINIPYCR